MCGNRLGDLIEPLKLLPVSDGDYHPHAATLMEWPDVEAWHALHQDADFKKVVPLREAAVERLDNLHTKIIF